MSDGSKAKVYRADLYGLREGKYAYLWENDVTSTQWEEVAPQTPFYLFEKQNAGLLEEYERAWKVAEMMPNTLLGPNSHRDAFAIAFSEEEAKRRLRDFADETIKDFEIKEKYQLRDNRDWSLEKARKYNFQGKEPVFCLYRPFDFRYMLYGAYAFDYHRPEINDHLLHENFALISTKQTKERFAVLATGKPVGQHKLATPYDGSYVSPLYLYPDNESLFAQPSDAPGGRRPNLSEAFVEDLKNKLSLDFVPDGRGDLTATFGPEDVFYYLYVVLHSPTYRERYAEFLKIDFPRIPFTSDRDLFADLCEKGKTLSDLHLMKTRGTRPANFPKGGDNLVDKPKYDDNEKHVYINKTQYFGNVPEDVWNFYVGGYQVLHKWLKDRKGRELSYEDTEHYKFIVAALADTIDLMNDIDVSIDAKGGFPLS